jgi:large subunit ribosomal protein L5
MSDIKYLPRLQKIYREKITKAMQEKFGYENIHQIPKLLKISINAGVGEGVQNRKIVESYANELSLIAGQAAVLTSAKQSISNFKLRTGMIIGTRVTLRKHVMYEFLDRFISVAVPRIRDFKGFSDKSFDGRGNYSIGIKEQLIFPEIVLDKVEKIHGFDITFVTNASTDEEAKYLMKQFGFPFRKPTAEQEVR